MASEWTHVEHNFPPHKWLVPATFLRLKDLTCFQKFVSIYQAIFVCIDTSIYLYQDSILVLIQIWRFTLWRVEKQMKSMYRYIDLSISRFKIRPNPNTDWLIESLTYYQINFATSELEKMRQNAGILDILTWKYASRHSGVQFFNRSFFRHLNWKKYGKTQVFLTFWLGNMLLATTACNFSTSQLQKVVRDRQFFNILTWKCASRHSGVQFFNIWTSKSGLSMSVF